MPKAADAPRKAARQPSKGATKFYRWLLQVWREYPNQEAFPSPYPSALQHGQCQRVVRQWLRELAAGGWIRVGAQNGLKALRPLKTEAKNG